MSEDCGGSNLCIVPMFDSTTATVTVKHLPLLTAAVAATAVGACSKLLNGKGERVVERFNEEYYETPSVESIKPNQTKLLHGLEGSLNLAPFQKTIEGDENLYDILPREKSPLDEDIFLKRKTWIFLLQKKTKI